MVLSLIRDDSSTCGYIVTKNSFEEWIFCNIFSNDEFNKFDDLTVTIEVSDIDGTDIDGMLGLEWSLEAGRDLFIFWELADVLILLDVEDLFIIVIWLSTVSIVDSIENESSSFKHPLFWFSLRLISERFVAYKAQLVPFVKSTVFSGPEEINFGNGFVVFLGNRIGNIRYITR